MYSYIVKTYSFDSYISQIIRYTIDLITAYQGQKRGTEVNIHIRFFCQGLHSPGLLPLSSRAESGTCPDPAMAMLRTTKRLLPTNP